MTPVNEKESNNSCVYLTPLVRGFAAFWGINLLVVVPIVALFVLCVPQVFEIDIVAAGKVSIAVSCETNASGTFDFCSSAELYEVSDSCSCLFRGQFLRGVDIDAPALYLRSDSVDNLTIKCVRKMIGPFSKTLSPAEIAASYRGDGANVLKVASNGMLELSLEGGASHLIPVRRPVWSNWSCSTRGLCWGVIVAWTGELLMILLVCVIAFAYRRTPKCDHHVWQSLSLALIAISFFFYVVPLQSFFANDTVFPFSITQLLIDVFPSSLVAILVVFCGLMLTELLFGRVVHFVLFAFLVYEYLEVGVLLRGAPSFTGGDLGYYYNIKLIQLDWIAFSLAFIFVLVPYSKVKRYFTWMLACLFIMVIAAGLDSWIGGFREVGNNNSPNKWTCDKSEVPGKVQYSANKNVIVFVLDSVTSEAAKDALLESQIAKDSFDGFIAFDSNLGMQSQSDLATVGIFTGEHFRNHYSNRAGFMNKLTTSDSALADYLESSYRVYCILPPPELSCSYMSDGDNDSRNVVSATRSTTSRPLLWCSSGTPMFATTLITLCVFRITPFEFKPMMSRWLRQIVGDASEEYLYPYLRAAPVKGADGTFLYCHTHGAHVPHDVSSDGSRHGVRDSSYRAYLDHVKSVVAELAKLLNSIMNKGVYDCSTILVIADHGPHSMSDAKASPHTNDALPPYAFPMLWVKPANSRGPIVFDETTPTTHANLHKVLRILKDRNLTVDEIAMMLSSDLRVFIRSTRDGYDQWEVLPDMSVKSFQHVKVP